MKLATRGGADSCLFECSVCCLWSYYEGIWMCFVWILKVLCELIAMSIDVLPALILVVVLWGGLISLGLLMGMVGCGAVMGISCEAF